MSSSSMAAIQAAAHQAPQANQAAQQAQKSDAAEAAGSKAAVGQAVAPPTVAEARSQLNISIVQASFEVSISSGNESMSLLFKSAIESLNKTLAPELGENAIQNAVNQDNTPEGTAGRIVALSTGFLEAFKQNHVGEDEGAVLQKFMDTIRGGFEKGFQEASDILKGLNVMEGDIASNISKTYDLVMKGYADFEAAQKTQIAAAGQASGATASAENSVKATDV